MAARLLDRFSLFQQITPPSYIIYPLEGLIWHCLNPPPPVLDNWQSSTQKLCTLSQLSLASRPSMLSQFLKLHRYEYYLLDLPSEQITPPGPRNLAKIL